MFTNQYEKVPAVYGWDHCTFQNDGSRRRYKSKSNDDWEDTAMQEICSHVKLGYKILGFEAVHSEGQFEGVPVWTGKVLATISDKNENVKNLAVHWFATEQGDVLLIGKHYFFMCDSKTKVGSWKAWEDEVVFDPLTLRCFALKRGCLSVLVQNLLLGDGVSRDREVCHMVSVEIGTDWQALSNGQRQGNEAFDLGLER